MTARPVRHAMAVVRRGVNRAREHNDPDAERAGDLIDCDPGLIAKGAIGCRPPGILV
jgi:hypothetical protein